MHKPIALTRTGQLAVAAALSLAAIAAAPHRALADARPEAETLFRTGNHFINDAETAELKTKR